jgi:hypothetical protein
MSAASLIARGQRAAEALMVDTCTVKYQSGTSLNGTTGLEEPVYTTRFTSACKVQSRALVAQERDAGGHEATLVRLSIHLPISAGAVEVDDIVTITAATHDTQLVGRTFRVLSPVGKSFATARRIEVEETVA